MQQQKIRISAVFVVQLDLFLFNSARKFRSRWWFAAGLWLAGKSGRSGQDSAVVADKTTIRVFSISSHQQLTEVYAL